MQTLSYLLSRFTLLLLMGCLFFSCKPKDGDPGPAGAKGDTGAAGAVGAQGATGNLLFKSGFLTGTITGMGQDGTTPINETFRYEFKVSDQAFAYTDSSGWYHFSFTQYDSLGHSYGGLSIQTLADLSAARLTGANLNFYKDGGNHVLKYLQASYYNERSVSAPIGSVSDLVYTSVAGLTSSTTSGLLTGSYTWKVDNTNLNDANNNYGSFSNTDQALTVTGTFSIPVKKVTIIR